MTRPRRSAVEILPREAMRFDERASVPDMRDVFRVKSRSTDQWRRVEFDYACGSWSCDCLAGMTGTRCSHVATCEYYGRYDRALAYLRRLDMADLVELDARILAAQRGQRAGWLAIDVDADALGDVIAERLAGQAPVTRSGVSVEQARDELFG